MVSLKFSAIVIACALVANVAANPFELHPRAASKSCGKGTHKQGNMCLPNTTNAHCGNSNAQCTASPANGSPACERNPDGKDYSCGFACNVGYYEQGSKCFRNNVDTHCGNSDTSCIDPAHGTNSCVFSSKMRDFACAIMCDNGYSLTSSNTCQANSNTIRQCGPSKDVCAAPYSGHGVAICNNGDCDVKCNTGFRKRTIGGVLYCTK